MDILGKAKWYADKAIKAEEVRRGHKITGMSNFTLWMIEYSGYIDEAGYRIEHGKAVLN